MRTLTLAVAAASLQACCGSTPTLTPMRPTDPIDVVPAGGQGAAKDVSVGAKHPLILPGTNTTQEPPPPTISAAQCGDITDGGPVSGPGCLSGTIKCNESVIGHTSGGGTNFNTRFYEARRCTPATTDHSLGNERVYALEIPDGDWRIQITLDTPCADLDLAAIEYEGPECPGLEQTIDRCEMWPQDRTAREKMIFSSRGGSHWLLVVEPKTFEGAQENGLFAINVQCQPGL